ncbi:tenascin-like isoform X14 [Carcharodon carcharias]|uniref:tenascin-like isoform X14 n=1 Tax=Carcharodon carcharias TaxID=13397 RepID=UPI001B7E063E|nr:tenascin-like isoform X14 [Carcharodon carcharias]
MGLVFQILLLFVAVSLDGGDCGVFVKTIRERRALLPNITSGRPTTFNHVYNIKLPHCKTCSANISKPLARIFEAQDEARDDKRFEHTVDPANQVVFTHRINIPPQACGCDDALALLSRLEALEKQVATLRRQCSSNACCGAKRAMDCGAHGTFSPSTCGCVCEEGWSGPTCSKASCPVNCHPHQGDCVAGRCVCHEGFTGEDCSKEICPDDCNDQGRCIDDKCVCFPGYTGYGCTEEICPDDCKGRGKCVDGNCVCNKGYSGFDCGVKDCPGDCSDQGHCVEGKCVCNAGFSGRDCGLRDCPANCHGHGNCIKGKCVCKKGFTGTDCAVKACPQNCNDRGRCVNGKCVCNTGYSGPSCGVQTCPDNCNQRGKCVNGKCVCNTGYSGSSCSVQTCPDNCNQQGKCANGKCVCNTGYSGSSCSVQTCPDNCNQQGKCVNGKCVCNTGYSGSSCSVQTCPDNCNQQGKCVNGKCVCNTGYSGPSCGVQTCPDNCNQRGKCVNGKCVCNTGYSGPKCGVQNCPNNCNNQGRCTEGKCICKDGFTGNDCSIEIPTPAGLHVKKILETKATVGWQLPQVPVDTWEITFRPLKEDNGKLTNRLAGSKSSFQQIGLASGQEYEVTLRAEKDKKLGPAVSRTFTTLIDGPRNLHVVSATNSTIKLGWKKPQASIDHYRLNYSSATGKHSQVVVPPGDNSAILTGLEAGVEHTISLVGERGGHQSKAAATKGTTDQVASFRNVTVRDITAKAFRLSWKVPEGAFDSFVIQYRVSTSSARWEERKVQGRFRSAVLKGLSPATKYTVRLYGVREGQRTGPFTLDATTDSTEKVKPGDVGKLDGLTSSNITDRSLQLTWSAQKDFDTFHVHYRVDGSKDVQKLKLPGNLRSSIITGLRPSTKYTIYLYGVSSGQRTKPITTIATTADKEAVKLGSLSTSNITANSLRLSWTVDRAFDSFLIQYRVQGSEETHNITVTGGRRSHRIAGLRPTTRYTVYLYGISGGSRTEPLTTAVTTTERPQQSEVSDLSVSNITADSLQLSWVTEGEYDSFFIEYGAEEDQAMQNFTVTGAHRSSIITGLRPTTAYTFYLYGVSAGQRTKPLTAVATTKASTDRDKVKPSKVVKLENLSVSNITADSFQLSWSAEKDFDSFIIEYGVQGSEDVQNVMVTGDRRLSLITGLRPTTVYTVYVYGISGGVRTKPLSTIITTKASTGGDKVKPSKVIKLENLSVSNITMDSFQLSWGAEKVFDSFIIQYGVQGSEDVQNLTVTGDRRLSLITGLRPTTIYTVYVYGISGGVRTKPLSTVITTKASTDRDKVKPSKVIKLENLSVSNITVGSFQLSWGAEKDFDSFIIQYRVRGSEDVQNLTVTGDRRLSLITGLRPTTIYTVYVYGISGGVRTKPLSTVITTKASTDRDKVKPSKVVKLENLSVSNITANSFQLSWGAEKDFDSFMIQYGVRGSEDVQDLTVTGDRRLSLITGLRPTTIYTVYVYGISGGVRTKPLSTVITTKGKGKPKPSKLGGLLVSNVSSDSIPFSWMAEKGFDAFLIRYKVHGSGVVQNFTVNSDDRSTTITGLRPRTKYTVYVYGVYNGKRTKPLTRVVTTKAPTDKEAVKLGSLSTSNITANSLRLSWTVDRAFDSFLIQYRVQGSEETHNITVTGGQQSHRIVGLRPTTRYTVYLYGISGGSRTEPLTTAVTTTGDRETVTPVRLGSLSTTNITANSLRLSWTVDRAFDSFLIQYRVQGSEETHNITVAGEQQSHLIVGLRPAARYTVYLYGIFNGKLTKPLTTAVTTTVSIDTNGVKPSRLSKLIRLSGNNVTQDSLQIFWAAESGFDSFLIQYRVDGSEEVRNFTVPAHQQSSFIEGLRPSTKYLISLYGFSGSRRTRPLTTIITTAASADKEGEKSGKFGSLSFSNITADSLLLSWTAETIFDSFLIQYKSQGSETLQNITVTGDRRSTYITGLRPTTNYTIYLYGVSGGQLSRPLVALLTITAVPVHTAGFSTLGRLLVSNIDTHSLKLSWTVEEGAFDSFLVQYRDSQGRLGVKEVTVPGNLRNVTIADLIPSTEYLISLYGVLKNQQTEPIPIVARTARESRSRLRFTDLRDTSVTVHWAAPSAPVKTFKIFYVPTKQGAPRSAIIDGRKTNITLKGLVPDTKYEINLVAVQGAIESPPILDHFTTAPDAPSDLKAVNVSDTMALLVWRPAIAPINHYVITYSGQNVPTVSKNVPGNTAELQLTGLNMNTEYKAEIHSVKGDRKSPRISTSFVTGSDLPRDLTVRDISSTEGLVSWKSPRSPVTGYLLVYETEGSEAQQVKLDPVATSHRLRQLLPSTRYTVRLHALRDGERMAAITAYFSTVGARIPFPKDCGEERSNGRAESSVVTLYLNGNKDKPIKAYCDMSTNGGGWMVFQRRKNGKTNFMRNWKAYATGFGDLAGEHWLGLEYLHQMTSQQRYELRVDLRNDDESAYATYDNFVVESPAQKYKLKVGKYAGNAGNSLSYHHGSSFTTLDSDSDEALTNCAVSYRGGWWYKNCHRVNLNGEYGNNRDHQGVNWYGWKGFEFSIPFTEMKMRPYNFARAVRKE